MRSNIVISILKIVVTIYTAITLPFYFICQKPWKKVQASTSFQVEQTKDKYGRIIYSRKQKKQPDSHLFNYRTYSEALKHLSRDLIKVGRRDIVNEELQYDENGKPIMFNGRMLSKITLTDYQWVTRGKILDRADSIARGLQQLGVQQNEKVMIYAETSLEWFLVALALHRLSSITTTLFSTLSDSGIVHGLNQSESYYLVIDESLLTKIDKLQDEIKFIKQIIYISNHPASYKSRDTEVQRAKNQLANKYAVSSLNEVEKIGDLIEHYEFPVANPNDVMMIMYTSGTTGDPKGVIITHENFYTSVLNLWGRDLEQPISLSRSDLPVFLPMAHIFGYSTILTFFLSDGRMGFSSPFTLLNSSPSHVTGQVGDINLIKPDLFPAVPLVLEKLVSEIYRKLNARSPLAVEIFDYLMDYKIQWRSKGFDTPIINRLICQKINQEFGGRLQALLVTGAAFSERTHALTTVALNLVCIYNMYGSTETTCPMAIMMIDDLSYGRTGVPLNDFKYYLDDWHEGGYTTKDEPNPRGEIVVGGPTVALGYYNKPEETEKDFYTDDEGCRWFFTGDIGEVFPDGSLKIIDRKKDLVKLANGEYISLGKIETGLRSSDYVENICVVTEPFCSEIIALIMPNRLALLELATKLNLKHDFQQLCDDQMINDEIWRSIQQKCQQLGFKKRECPAKIILVKEEWTQANNMLTAASKMRRKTVVDFYKNTIESTFRNL